MRDFVVKIRISLVLILVISSWMIWVSSGLGEAQAGRYLKVVFLDIGQGDAIFIETPNGTQVLIDGGPNSTVLRELSKEIGFFDRTIDILVGTHPDKDHIAGLVDVFDRYEVTAVFTTENKGNSILSQVYKERILQEEAEVVYMKRGQIVQLDASTTLQVLFPELGAGNMESNASSIVLRLVYGDTSFLFTGDSPKRIEKYLVLVEGKNLKSDVLKVGHHGSRTSTSKLFLDEVSPEYAVISVGKDNRYGHPNAEVIDALFNAGVEIFSTEEVGTVKFVSDGKEVWVE